MSWKVEIKRIESIHPIEGADAIETAIIGNGWPVVVRKGTYSPGSKVIYYPKDSLMPPEILERIGLTGKLSGPGKNRVKAIKLRGQLSIGIVEPATDDLPEGEDLSARFGVTQFEMDMPVSLRGRVRPKPPGFIKYDLENIRNDDPFEDGEECVIEPKIHGAHASVLWLNGELHVASRNLNVVRDENNSYWKAAIRHGLEDKLRTLGIDNIWLDFELVPVNNFKYGLTDIQGLFYDVRVGDTWLNYDDAQVLFKQLDLPTLTPLYRGPYNKTLAVTYRGGMETVSGKGLHIQEGCVIRAVIERVKHRFGRVIVKSVNPEFLLKHDDGMQ